jgi:hypothetical protein
VTVLALGTLGLGLGVAGLFAALIAVAAFAARGGGVGIHLGADPVERSERLRADDEADVHRLLEELNARRAARGEPPQTMAEYVEDVRRRE